MKSPNVVLVFSCAHNPHVMGCAGHPIVQTPHLDALAARGARFTNVYTPYPLTVPARMAFLAGQYTGDIGIWDLGSALSSDVPTFAHALGSGGYEAALCGKMYFRGQDQFHGFEKRLLGDPLHGFAEGADEHPPKALSPEVEGFGSDRTTSQTRYAVQTSGYGPTGFQLFDRTVARKACDYIAAHTPSDRPYCLVCSLILPRNPLICDRTWFDYYYNRVGAPEPMAQTYLDRLHPAVKVWRERRGVDEITPEQHRRGRAAYYGLVSEMDENVGQIVAKVRDSAEANNTVVIYCSDHGDMAGEHGMWWKSNFYNGTVQVPLIISGPGRSSEAKTIDALRSLIDVGPTVLEMTGCPSLPDVSGRSLVPLLHGEAPDLSRDVFSDFIGLLGDQPSCMIRSGPWKLNYYGEFGSYQLFNLEEDPEEMFDRRDDPACAGIAQQCLEKIHHRWSAERMLEQAAIKRRAQQIIARSGHDLTPHPVTHFVAPPGYNEFDFSQLPSG